MHQRSAILLLVVLLTTPIAPVYAHVVDAHAHGCTDELCTCPPDCPHHADGHGRQAEMSPEHAGMAAGQGGDTTLEECDAERDCHLATPQTPGHPLTIKALPDARHLVIDPGPGSDVYTLLSRELLRAHRPEPQPPRN